MPSSQFDNNKAGLDDKTNFIFIASLPYSGSTLLSFLLATHPQIATIGEMTGVIESEDPDEYLCSCGEKIIECDFWKSIKASMAAKDITFDVANFNMRYMLGTQRYIRRLRTGSLRSNQLEAIRDVLMRWWPGQTQQLKRIGSRNQALVESVLDVTGKPVFLDSSKYHMRIKYQLRYTSLDIKVIHLVRDPRGVVNSYLNYNPGMTSMEAAKLWVYGNHNIERQLHALPNDGFIRVRYEDLCTALDQTLERLYSFCGVEVGFHADDIHSAAHHIVGNKMRLRNLSEIKLDERWKKTLTENQLVEIDKVAKTRRHDYGY